MKKSILIAGSVTAAAGTATAIAVPIVLTSDNSTENIEAPGSDIRIDNVNTDTFVEVSNGTHQAQSYITTFDITSCGNQGEDIVLTSDEWIGELTIPCVESDKESGNEHYIKAIPINQDVNTFRYNLFYGYGDSTNHTSDEVIYNEGDLMYDDLKTFELNINNINGEETVKYLEVS